MFEFFSATYDILPTVLSCLTPLFAMHASVTI